MIPIRMNNSGSPRARHSARIESRHSCISTATKQVLSAWSLNSRGAPKKAMMASPSNLSTVPSYLSTMSVILVRYSFNNLTSFSGSSFSDIDEKPATSEKNAVISRRSPPSFKRPGLSTNWFTTVGAMYWLKAPLMKRFSRCSKPKW